jgi:IclR family transcriptional regulator, pca regulon regulatory protein
MSNEQNGDRRMRAPRKSGPKAAEPEDDLAEAPETDITDEEDGDVPRKAFVRSLERGLSVVMAFDADHPRLSLSDVARITRLDRAAARRFLYTLVGLGYMRIEGRTFSLRPKLLELGHAYLSTLRLPEIAEPHLRGLSDEVHESSYVSIYEENENICVAHVPVRRIWTATITVGTRLPLLATASGRVLLSDLEPGELRSFLKRHSLKPVTPFTKHDPKALEAEILLVRDQGWAFVDQELEVGLRVVAAPIRNPQGRIIAAVSVSTLASLTTPEVVLRDFLPPVLRTAEAIETDLAPVMR